MSLRSTCALSLTTAALRWWLVLLLADFGDDVEDGGELAGLGWVGEGLLWADAVRPAFLAVVTVPLAVCVVIVLLGFLVFFLRLLALLWALLGRLRRHGEQLVTQHGL